MTKHAFSAVTVQVERLTSEQYEENDIGGVVDLIEVIRIQSSGPTEAARALRKKLKYGNVHRQIRALVILDALIQNAGTRFQKGFADEPLLERLRILARDDMVDAEVRQKVNVLFRQWAVAYKGTPGLERIATLHKELPRTKRPQPQQSRIVRQQDAEAAREREEHSPPPSPPRTRRPEPHQASPSIGRTVALGASTLPGSSIFRKDKKDKKHRGKTFNLEKEKGQLLETIASANVASTNLLNGLQLINREQQRVSENPEVMRRFETCKQLRRQILRYIHLVESEQYIGGLLNANDELVKGLMAFEIMDKSIDDDSDSDNEPSTSPSAESGMARLRIDEPAPVKPPRPMSIPMPPAPAPAPASGKQRADPESEPEDDEDDPFGDQNVVNTPRVERGQPTWRDV
ncbi:VHS domain-containing protein [Cucurbitaria berberidis CBS 394.84]|uniref:VHS domain-containing protein n=1 Tax=Cucurbitaria berberidis CBS 394.84 TaxID=1168544 RepID=A0A9P4GPE2_9PLEO|nr:VHS domain-containing protein [Cucurbitaria berberidis CBS 394.84]KAF1850218.1 VHS domain-containing protein [Cucurbitaria berberidis CBS 394.84]